jgi:FMN-dependent NADH-azoreductase
MTGLLHLSASPRGDRSESRAIAETFLDIYRDVHPEHVIDHFDLWDGSLPAFGPA